MAVTYLIKRNLTIFASLVICTIFVPELLFARTSLVSLPQREAVEIRLTESGQALIQEKRVLALKKGLNRIDFSWQGVRIDVASISLFPLSHPDRISLLNVSYPPNEAALIWEISSSDELKEEVMISYLLLDIDKVTAYTMISDEKESRVSLKTFLVVRNFSGETFDKANLITGAQTSVLLSTDHLETKRLLVSSINHIPVTKHYTWDALTMPHDPEKLQTAVGIPTTYRFDNNKLSHLGTIPLSEGKVRIYQDDGSGGTIFLGDDTAAFTPVDETMTLKIGDSRDIIVTQRRLETLRQNIRRNNKGQIQVYDEMITDQVVIENLKDKVVTLSLIETLGGQWEPVDMPGEYEKKDHKTLVFKIALIPKQNKTVTLKYKVLNIFASQFSQFNWVNGSDG
jgi:hypothetical protein